MYTELLIYFLITGTALSHSKNEPSIKELLDKFWLARTVLPEAYLFKYESEGDLNTLFEGNEANDENEFKPPSVANYLIRTARNARLYDRRDNNQYSNNNTAASPTANGPGIKAKLKYHHEQRHPNGSVSGSYGQSEPDGRLKIIHYVKDDKGYYKEYPETTNNLQPANNGAAVPQTTRNMPPNDRSVHLNNRRGVYYSPLEGQDQSPILQSAVGSVRTYMEKSPLHDKYYRPSPQEVQQAYEYHRLRSVQNPDAFRPRDATPLPDLPPLGKQPEIKGVYGEYRSPITNIRYTERTPATDYYSYSSTPPVNDVRYYNSPPAVTVSSAVPAYAPTPQQPIYSPSPGPDLQTYSSPPPELINPTPQYNPSIEQQQYAGGPQPELYPQLYYPTYYAPYGGLYVQNPYPQTLPVQNPVYVQTDGSQPFALGSTYSGPQSSNTATFNQPYPSNVPIYQQQPVPQNVPTYVQVPPENVPIYHQQTPAAQLAGNSAIPPGLPPEALAYAGVNPNNLVVNAAG